MPSTAYHRHNKSVDSTEWAGAHSASHLDVREKNIMKWIKGTHYVISIPVASAYCSILLHSSVDIFPFFFIGLAVLLALPLLSPFMAYQESIYPTPAVIDFPILIVIYPLYFSILFSPLLIIAFLNERRNPEQGEVVNSE